MIDIIAQVIGYMGMALSILSFLCKENKKFFITQALSGACFATNFLLLGSTTAAYLNFINIFRGWVFGFAPKKWRGLFAIITGLMYIVATVFTYDGWLSLLVLVAQLAGTAVMYTDNGKIIRIVQLGVVSPAWFAHNLIVRSVPAVLCEVFAITTTVIALVKYRKTGFISVEDSKKNK